MVKKKKQKEKSSPFNAVAITVAVGAAVVAASSSIVFFSPPSAPLVSPSKVYSNEELKGISLTLIDEGHFGDAVINVAPVSNKDSGHYLVRISSFTRSVVVKQFAPGVFVPTTARNLVQMQDSYRDPTLDYEREVAALNALNTSYIAPSIFASRDADGIVIVEDLQPLEPLFVHMGVRIGKQKDIPISPFTTDPIALGYLFLRLAEALAVLHSPKHARAFQSAPKKWLFAVNREQDHKLIRDSAERFLAAAAAVRSDHSAPLLKFDLDAISASIRDPPNAFLALTHGDVCVDNIFVTAGKGARVRLLDFSSAGLRHSLSDVAAVMLLFPTCWCAGDIPWPFLKRFASMHRHRLAMLADSDEARGTIENDAVYFEELIKMCAYHLVVVISEYWDSAINEDETCGHVPCRHHISARVSSFLRMYEAFSAKARVPIANLHRVIVAFRNDLARTWEGRWPSFPPFPTFASLGSFATVSAVRSAAAREELKRLRHVSRRDVAWAVLNDKRVRVVVWDESFRANDLLSQGVPTLIKGSPTSSWAAMEWNHNASAFASAYGDKQLFAKLSRRLTCIGHPSALVTHFVLKLTICLGAVRPSHRSRFT